MGSQSSKFGPESVVGSSKREHAINFASSTSKSGMETRIKQSIDETHTKEPNLINTSFKWTYGGNSVFVTGTFTGWKDHVPLQKVGNEFNTILRLPKGIYYYKFIVDGEWKFSPDDFTAPDDHGNINNIIDTTTIESVNKIIGSSDNLRKPVLSEPRQPKTENPFTEEAPLLPTHLLEVYFLNERDNKLKEQSSILEQFDKMELEDVEVPKLENKEDPRKEFIGNKLELGPPTHVTLNHLSLYGPFESTNKNYCVTSMTQRFKSKYATIQFYSSKFSQVH